jgi:hypothetical protein
MEYTKVVGNKWSINLMMVAGTIIAIAFIMGWSRALGFL